MELAEQSRASGLESRGAEQAAAPVNRLALLRSVRELRSTLGLSLTDCAVLEKIADTTARSAWTTEADEVPINWRRQQDMAAEIGITARQWRNVEARLAARRLIDRAVTVNGWRGCAGAQVSGLSCAPLRERAEELAALEAAEAERRNHMAELRLTVGKARRRAQRLAAEHPETEYAARFHAEAADWPTRLRSLCTPAELQAHLEAVESLVAAGEEAAVPPEISAAAETDCRRHIQPTLNPNSCSRSTKTSQTNSASNNVNQNNHHDPCYEASVAAGTALPPKLVARLDTTALRRLASSDLRLYIDNIRDPGTPRRIDDIEAGVLMRLAEIRISPQTFEGAQAALGWFAALVAVIVLDRNRTHPSRPVKNPGGALRAMVKRHAAGTLDLGASVHGIWQRDAASQTPEQATQ